MVYISLKSATRRFVILMRVMWFFLQFKRGICPVASSSGNGNTDTPCSEPTVIAPLAGKGKLS
jgi:hypothetical protein